MITDLLAGLLAQTGSLQGKRKDVEAVLELVETERAVAAQVSTVQHSKPELGRNESSRADIAEHGQVGRITA